MKTIKRLLLIVTTVALVLLGLSVPAHADSLGYAERTCTTQHGVVFHADFEYIIVSGNSNIEPRDLWVWTDGDPGYPNTDGSWNMDNAWFQQAWYKNYPSVSSGDYHGGSNTLNIVGTEQHYSWTTTNQYNYWEVDFTAKIIGAPYTPINGPQYVLNVPCFVTVHR